MSMHRKNCDIREGDGAYGQCKFEKSNRKDEA